MDDKKRLTDADYKRTNGLAVWAVSTQGDVEGKSPDIQLGTYVGYIEDIALLLSHKRELIFELKEELDVSRMSNKVRVSFAELINTTGEPDRRADFVTHLLGDRGKAKAGKSTYYGSAEIIFEESNIQAIVKKQALAKLTAAEREALGL